MKPQREKCSTDTATTIVDKDRSAARKQDASLRILLADFTSDLCCQLGLLLRERGHRVVAQSSEAQFAKTCLDGCDEMCFPCTEINFPYLARNNIESVLEERGPFDVIVFDQPDVDEQVLVSAQHGPDAQEGAEVENATTKFLSEAHACTQHLAARGGAMWLFEIADTAASAAGHAAETPDAHTLTRARSKFLQHSAQDARYARVSFNTTRFMPKHGQMVAITFDGCERIVCSRPLPQRPRSPMELVLPLLELIAGNSPPASESGTQTPGGFL